MVPDRTSSEDWFCSVYQYQYGVYTRINIYVYILMYIYMRIYEDTYIHVAARSICCINSGLQNKHRHISNAISSSLHSEEVSFWFLSIWKEYDRSDCFPFDYEPIKFNLVQNQKENRHYTIIFLAIWK